MQKIVFAQLLEFIPKRQFRRLVERFGGNHRVRTFSCWDQFVCMSFAQLTWREGLRDIELCLRSMHSKLHHLGLQGRVSRSTLADANEIRDSRIYAELCKALIKKARELYADEKFSEELDEAVYVLDSTYISLCLSMFPWTRMGGHTKGIFKLHSLLDLRGSIPSFIAISSGLHPDNKMLDRILIEPGAFYVMDKAYVDFARLYNINSSKGFFVVRFKENIKFKRLNSLPADQNLGVLADQVGLLTGKTASKKYPDKIRKVVFWNKKKGKKVILLTNNFALPPELIAEAYRQRWQIEIFFKWIKQNLRIKKFYGTSQNAVETQIWIAISTYLIIAIAKKQLRIKTPLYQILHFLSISLFENIPLLQALNPPRHLIETQINSNQLNLFER